MSGLFARPAEIKLGTLATMDQGSARQAGSVISPHGMRLERLAPHPRLSPYVAKLWHFESPSGMPLADMKTVVPNGMLKLIFPCRGALQSHRGPALLRICPEAAIAVVGLQERPVTIEGAGPLSTIGVELHAHAAYRFFRLSLSEVTNRVCLADEILEGREGARRFEARAAEAPTFAARLAAIQALLIHLLDGGREPDRVVEWMVGEIRRRDGVVRIAELCRDLGYSRRYVDRRFAERVGVSPKALAGVVRFQRVFGEMGAGVHRTPSPSVAWDLYYDQPHFVREFKRFAGRSPGSYLGGRNEFGELFYRR
jgi:AraC-like DNA-binding protein